jgi:SpoVK/Ycf46/Vps4 family AAA+-type ATPase
LHKKVQEIQGSNTGFKAHREAKWVGSMPEKIAETLQVMANKDSQALAAATNINNPNGFLFYGPPGNGKTFLGKKIAKHLDACFLEIKASDLLSKWIGESEQAVAGIIQRGIEEQKKTGKPICVILLDEIEGIAFDRSSEKIINIHDTRVLDTLLQVIEMANSNNILFIGATNYFYKVDSAIRRSGRLEPIEITFPSDSEQRELITYYTNVHFGINPSDYFINYFVKQLRQENKKSRADIMAIIRDFATQSINLPKDQLTKLRLSYLEISNQDEVIRNNSYIKYLDALLIHIKKCSLDHEIETSILNPALV